MALRTYTLLNYCGVGLEVHFTFVVTVWGEVELSRTLQRHTWESCTAPFTLNLVTRTSFRLATRQCECEFVVKLNICTHSSFTNRWTYTKTLIKFTLELYGSYTFRFTTIIRELAIEPG